MSTVAITVPGPEIGAPWSMGMDECGDEVTIYYYVTAFGRENANCARVTAGIKLDERE